MILSDSAILAAIERGDLVVDPFNRARLGSNSYDVTLAATLMVYGVVRPTLYRSRLFVEGPHVTLDAAKDNPTQTFDIPDVGLILEPGCLYLGCTVEWTSCSRTLVPFLEGKSSCARLGMQVHLTAGVGDAAFAGRWTLEIVVARALRVYAGMPIAQLLWHEVAGDVLVAYDEKGDAKYANSRSAPAMPVASAMWKNFTKDKE